MRTSKRNAEYWREYRRKNRERLRVTAKARRIANREIYRNRRARWAEQNPEKVRDSQRRYYLKRLKKSHTRARWLVSNAIAVGKLKRGPCEICGATKTAAHHDDYSAPLSVRWLCNRHHRAWHRVFVAEHNGSTETRTYRASDEVKK